MTPQITSRHRESKFTRREHGRKASSDLAESWQEEGVERKHLGLEHAKGYRGVAAASDEKRSNSLDGKTAVLALE